MRFTIKALLVSLFFVQFVRSETPYISPGLGVSWDFHGHFIMSPKISFGIFHDGMFYNLTLGRSTSSETNLYPHFFIEGQVGRLTKPSDYRKIQIFYGGGIGLSIPVASSHSGPSLRTSLFLGDGLFVNTTFLFENSIKTEMGVQLVAPIPLKDIPMGPGKN